MQALRVRVPDARSRRRPVFVVRGVKFFADGALGSRGARAARGLRRRAEQPRPVGHRAERAARAVDAAVRGGLAGRDPRDRRRRRSARARRVRGGAQGRTRGRSPAAGRARAGGRARGHRAVRRARASSRRCSRRTRPATCRGPSSASGAERIKGAYAWRTMLDKGARSRPAPTFPSRRSRRCSASTPRSRARTAKGKPAGRLVSRAEADARRGDRARSRAEPAYAAFGEANRGMIDGGSRSPTSPCSIARCAAGAPLLETRGRLDDRRR